MKLSITTITFIMLFIGFPFILYFFFSVGYKSFNMFEWDTTGNPGFFLYALLNLVSIGIGVGLLNDNDYGDNRRR